MVERVNPKSPGNRKSRKMCIKNNNDTQLLFVLVNALIHFYIYKYRDVLPSVQTLQTYLCTEYTCSVKLCTIIASAHNIISLSESESKNENRT